MYWSFKIKILILVYLIIVSVIFCIQYSLFYWNYELILQARFSNNDHFSQVAAAPCNSSTPSSTLHFTSQKLKDDNKPTTTALPHRYVLESINWEQLTMATNNIVTLAWLAKNWSAQAVEPFTKNSRLYGIPKDKSMRPMLDLLYDREKFNKLLTNYDIAPVAKYNEFIENANRNVTLVYILFDGMGLGSTEDAREYISLQKGKKILDCSNTRFMKKKSEHFIKSLNKYILNSLRHFTVTHSCCINNSHSEMISRQRLMEGCSISPTGDITVAFFHWKGITESPKKAFRLVMKEAHQNNMPHPMKDMYPYTESIISNATAFVSSIMYNSKKFTGLHLRTEKILHNSKLGNQTAIKVVLEKCISLASSVIGRGDSEVIALTDMGNHGSKSMKMSESEREMVHDLLAARGIKVYSYDPLVFNGVDDSGFVAAVEQEVMSRASLLVTLGGGSFQRQLVVRFHKHNKKKLKAYSVCDDLEIKIRQL